MNYTKQRHLPILLLSGSISLSALLHGGAVAALAAGSPPPLTSTQFKVTMIDIPDQSWVTAFPPNNQGMVSGFYFGNDGFAHGYLWQDGQLTPLDAPGWANTLTFGVNDRGMIAGHYDDNVSVVHGFVYNIQDRTWKQMPDIPDLPFMSNMAINSAGTVVGSSWDGVHGDVGWTWDGKSYAFFTIPGANQSTGLGTIPLGINDRGQLTGFYDDVQGAWHGFFKDGSSLTTIDVPGADSTEAFSINNRGDIVGLYRISTPQVEWHGFILHQGQFFTLPWGATGINDRGELASSYVDALGTWHGVVAKPQGNRNP